MKHRRDGIPPRSTSALPAEIALWCERVRRPSLMVVLDLDSMSPAPVTAHDPVLTSVLTALTRIGVDSILISTYAENTIEVNRRFTCFDDALKSIRTLAPDAYVITIGAADEHAAAFLQNNDVGIELCAAQRRRDRMVARESVRDFLWWLIDARCTLPAWAPPLAPLLEH